MSENKKPVTRRKTTTKPKDPSKSKHTPKALEERFELKHEVANRLRQGQSRHRVAESMIEDGLNISKNTVYSYARQIHEEWTKAKNDSYELHIARQLAMLDAMIEQCWEMLDRSKRDEHKVVEEYRYDYKDEDSEGEKDDNEGESGPIGIESTPSDENPKGRTKIRRVGLKSEGSDQNPKGQKKIISEKIQKASRDGDIEVLKMLERFWVRRCEVLGITLNTTINIQNNQFNETTIQANIQKPVSNQFFRAVVIEEDQRTGISEAEAEIIEDEKNEN